MADTESPYAKGTTRMERAAEEAKGLLLDDVVGRKEWQSSKISYILGLGMIGQFWSSMGSSLGGASSRIGRLWKGATGAGAGADLPAIEEEDPEIRFVAALEVYGKSDADLSVMARNSHRGFWFYALMVAIMTVVGLASFRMGGTGLPGFVDVAVRFGTLPLLLALMLRFGHLNWVLRNRSLGGPLDYLKSGDILPGRALGRAAAVLIAVLMAGAFFVSPNEAHAITPADIFGEPNKDDVFFNMLGYIVPGIGPVTGYDTNGHQAMAKAFLAFSAVLMMIGSLMLSWHVVVGIVSSAHTGKVLGERWHQIWAPARVTLGLGSLAPIAGGYGAAQVLVVYLVVWGGNFANAVWTPYVEALSQGITGPTSTVNSTEASNKMAERLAGAEDVIFEIARREICNATVNKYNEVVYKGASSGGWFTGNSDTNMVNPAPSMTAVETVTNAYAFGDPFAFSVLDGTSTKGGVTYSNTIYRANYGQMCGSIEIAVDKVLSGGVGTPTRAHYESAQKFDESRLAAISAAISKIRPRAQAIANTYVPGSGSETTSGFDTTNSKNAELQNNLLVALREAATEYRNTMIAASKAQIAALDVTKNGKSMLETLVKEASTKGWANAGAYYVTLTNVQGAVYAKAQEKPTYKSIDLNTSSSLSKGLVKAVSGTPATDRAPAEPGSVVGFDSWWPKAVQTGFSGSDLDSARAGRLDKNSDVSFGSIMSALDNNGMLVWSLSLFKDMNPFNPMKSMVDFGHTILNWFYIVMGVFLLLSIGGAIVGAIVGTTAGPAGGVAGAVAGAALGKISTGVGTIIVSFVQMLVFALFAVGVVHAYVIPMIPYIQVTFFLMGMLVLLVESLIAAPLWAFFHVRMDGQELIDQVQKPGYMIAFNLLLRPVLMVLGLMMSFFVFGAMAWFISNTFTLAAVSAGGEHTVGIIGIVVMIVIMTYLHYQIALRSFSLINQVPDRVIRWFGQGGENLGEDQETRQATNIAVGHISGRTERLLGAAGVGSAASNAVGKGRLPSSTVNDAKKRQNAAKKTAAQAPRVG